MQSRHPLGVQPWGNFLVGAVRSTREEGLGELGQLSDELLLCVMDLLDPRSLACVSCVSKTLRCFSCHEELWKKHVLERWKGAFGFERNWKSTYTSLLQERNAVKEAQISSVEGFYSDLLYQPWFCAHLEIPTAWLETDNVTRCQRIPLTEFRERFEQPNIPVVLQGLMDGWKAQELWTRSYFSELLADEAVIVGNYAMQFKDYICYCDSQEDELPLYLFDKQIFHKRPELDSHFVVPAIFSEDLFSCLDERPDHKWLIMGPERSGSSFHKDPNSTSAWNAVIRGSKKWILYPPSVLPPGVHQSFDGSEVATSISLIEWFLNFYQETKENEVKPVECVVREGEVLFVPRGWWHLAMNLEETIAITQNFVSSVTLPHVLGFLRSRKSSLVSGLPLEQRAHLYDAFAAALEKHFPQELKAALSGQVGQKRMPLPEIFLDRQSVTRQSREGENDEIHSEAQPVAACAFKFDFF